MTYILTGEEATDAFHEKNRLSTLEQEEFNKKINQAALDLQLLVKKCELSALPEFVKKSNSRLYVKELDVTPEPSAPTKKTEKPKVEDDDNTNPFFKDIYQVTCKDASSYFVMQNGLGSRMVSDNWTEESIDKCAEMSAKLGGKCHMIPSGEPGAFPDHLRAYATQAFAKHGIDFPDPTPPTAEKVTISKQKYGLSSPQPSDMKEKLAAMRSKEGNNAPAPSISTSPKP